MKKLMCLCMVVISVFLNVAEARADLIVEPENSFIRKHEWECEQGSRKYIVNGPDEEVLVYESPISDKVTNKMKNGTEFWSYWVYEDTRGIKWVYYSAQKEGWIPLDYLSVVYDYISFEKEYGKEFVGEHGQLGAEYGDSYICAWMCPGGKEKEQILVGTDYRPEYDITYVDDEGRTWAYCVYYMGFKNFWMCLDDLDAEFDELYPNGSNIPEVENKQVNWTEDSERIVPKTTNTIWLIGLGVTGVVAVTAVVLVILKKKMRF